MELEQALARIAELEGQVTALTGERDALTGERDATAGRAAELEADQSASTTALAVSPAESDGQDGERVEATALTDAMAEVRARGLAHLRRALLAEHAGQVVPELVTGDSEEVLLASVDVAKQAYTRALDAARATLANQAVPVGAPSARAVVTAGLSPLEMIESGLRTSGR